MKYLRLADFGGERINFTLNGFFHHKSELGGVFTLLLTAFAIFLTYNFSFDMINKENPSLLQQDLVDNDNATLQVDDPLFNIVLQPYFWTLDGPNDYRYNSSIFKFGLEYRHYYNNYTNDGTVQRIESTVPLEIKRCNISDFDPKLHSYFNSNSFGDAYCLKNKSLLMKGQYISPNFQFLKVFLKGCDGKDSLTGEKVVCESFAKIEEAILRWRFSLYFTYATPRYDNYEEPFSPELTSMGYVLSSSVYPRDNHFFSYDTIITEDSWFVPSEGTKQNYPMYVVNQPSTAVDSTKTGSKKFLDIFVRVFYTYKYAKRIYKKIPEVLAQVMPFIQIVRFVFVLFHRYFHRVDVATAVINHFFSDVNQDEQVMYNKIKSSKKEKSLNLMNVNINPLSVNNYVNKSSKELNPNTSEFNPINRKLMNSLAEDTTGGKKISKFAAQAHSFNSYTILNCFRNTPNKKIFIQLRDKVFKQMEVTSYFNVAEDIRKLRSLVLDRPLANLFKVWPHNYSIGKDCFVRTDWLENFVNYDQVVLDYEALSHKDTKSRKEQIVLDNINQL